MKNLNIKNRLINTFLIFTMTFISSNVTAEEGAIRFSNNAFKQVTSKTADGRVQFDYVEPALVLPEDIIFYEIVFENISDKEVNNIVINNPIANNSVYRLNSADGASTEITFSADGETYAGENDLIVKDKTGRTWKAKADDYKHIRWVYKKSLNPGQKSRVSYKTSIK